MRNEALSTVGKVHETLVQKQLGSDSPASFCGRFDELRSRKQSRRVVGVAQEDRVRLYLPYKIKKSLSNTKAGFFF